MRMRWFCLTLWFGCLGLSPSVHAQADVAIPSLQGTSDAAVYGSFFQQAASQHETASPVLLNGQPSHLIQPSLQDALGLTLQQAQTVQAVALACKAKLVPLGQAIRSLVLEARLQSLHSGAVSSDVRRRLAGLEDEQDRLTRLYRQQLQEALGSSVFQVLDGYIQVRKSTGQFFPPVAANQ